jgi:hypothetical protein
MLLQNCVKITSQEWALNFTRNAVITNEKSRKSIALWQKIFQLQKCMLNDKSRKSIVFHQEYRDYRITYVCIWKVKEEHCTMPEILWLQINIHMHTKEKSRKSIVLCQKYCGYRLMYIHKWKVKGEHCVMPEILWLQNNVCIHMKSQGRSLHHAKITVITD